MMKFLLVSRIDNPDALAFTGRVRSTLVQDGHTVILDADTASALGTGGVPLAGAVSDVVIVVGGDGTILRAIQQMEQPAPVLGVNWGEVGFFADLEHADALPFIRQLAQGFSVEERMRIAFKKDGKHLGTALNEALIVTTRPAKMLRFSIVIDGIVAEQFRADGLLISTPTGSTAYAMSAGGPIVDPRMEEFLIVPLAPFMLSNRPHLIDSSRTVRITLEAEKPAKLVIDGLIIRHIGEQSTIDISRSPRPAQFVNAGQNFFEKINRKLRHL